MGNRKKEKNKNCLYLCSMENDNRVHRVWDYDFGYAFFRPYIHWAARTCYSSITVEGVERVPDAREASVLLCSNHCGTLMDALLVLLARREPTAFVARADIFKRPFFAHILTNLRILPIYRRRDGEDSQQRNEAVFGNVVECLNHGMALCILPEGTHRPRRSLLPLKKGVFRIAQQALEEHPDRPVYVVPIGLDYHDFFHLMYPAKITFGEPMEVHGGEDLDVLTEELRCRMSTLFPCFPDDEELAAREAALDASRRRTLRPLDYLLAIVLLPLFVQMGILCSPMLLATAFLKRRLKDKTWVNTVRFSCKLALTPFTVAAALVAGFIHLPWWGALSLGMVTLYAHPVFYGLLALYRECVRQCRSRR